MGEGRGRDIVDAIYKNQGEPLNLAVALSELEEGYNFTANDRNNANQILQDEGILPGVSIIEDNDGDNRQELVISDPSAEGLTQIEVDQSTGDITVKKFDQSGHMNEEAHYSEDGIPQDVYRFDHSGQLTEQVHFKDGQIEWKESHAYNSSGLEVYSERRDGQNQFVRSENFAYDSSGNLIEHSYENANGSGGGEVRAAPQKAGSALQDLLDDLWHLISGP